VKTVEEKIRETTPETEQALASRTLTVEFNADVEDGMPWRFRPTQRYVEIKPGESALAFYTAENTSKQAITGVSTYNVTPQAAGVYFNKIQCFCFEVMVNEELHGKSSICTVFLGSVSGSGAGCSCVYTSMYLAFAISVAVFPIAYIWPRSQHRMAFPKCCICPS